MPLDFLLGSGPHSVVSLGTKLIPKVAGWMAAYLLTTQAELSILSHIAKICSFSHSTNSNWPSAVWLIIR